MPTHERGGLDSFRVTKVGSKTNFWAIACIPKPHSVCDICTTYFNIDGRVQKAEFVLLRCLFDFSVMNVQQGSPEMRLRRKPLS